MYNVPKNGLGWGIFGWNIIWLNWWAVALNDNLQWDVVKDVTDAGCCALVAWGAAGTDEGVFVDDDAVESKRLTVARCLVPGRLTAGSQHFLHITTITRVWCQFVVWPLQHYFKVLLIALKMSVTCKGNACMKYKLSLLSQWHKLSKKVSQPFP